MRKLNKSLSYVALVISVMFSALYFYTSGFGVISAEIHRGFYVLFTAVLCILYYPANKKHPDSKILYVFDALMIILSVAATLYWVLNYATYASERVGLPYTSDIVFGAIMIICSLEITRRVLGNTLVILGIVFTLQLYFGPHLGGIFGHKGMSIERILENDFMTMAGMFGTIVNTFATYIMPFLIFGAFLEKSGGGEFFIDLSKALTGKIPGGPALIAVIASAIFGSISGSPIANVLATGAFTIPMMKKTGYRPEFAGAVEAAASTGGQFLPPIMGAGAFILASLTQTSYGTVVMMALVPALLYYLSVGMMVYFEAKKHGLCCIPEAEIPKLGKTLKEGWYYLFVLVVAVTVIVLNYAAESVAFYSTIFIIVCAAFKKETRFTPIKLIRTFESAAKSSLMVGSCAATLGLVMGGITLAGLGVKFSKLLLVVAGGSIFLDIIMILIIALVIGMGLPTTASYIVMAILAAPSLVLLGVPEIQAHLLVFWLAMTSNVTPPVCVTAFAAASVADANPMKTGLIACKLAALLYIMPFTFVYRPSLMLIGTTNEIVVSIFMYIIAVIALAGGLQGWLLKDLGYYYRGLLIVIAGMIMLPGGITDFFGTMIFIAVLGKLYCDVRNNTLKPNVA